MHPKIHAAFDSAEREKNRLIVHVSTLSLEDYFRIPAPGKWSVAQIMTHLVITEQLSLRYMKKKSLGINEVKDSGIMHEARFWLYKGVMKLPIKLKAPKTILDNTPEAWPLSELKVHWGNLRNDLETFLSTIKEDHIHRMIYKHAFAGRLDVIQAIHFFIAHIHHHRPQIERIMNASGTL